MSTEKNNAETIVDFLESNGVRHVFDLTGGMITYIEDAVSKKDGIECVPMHHEQAAGFAADGYARAGADFGVAIATSGPGATNLITAIGDCYFDSVPVLFITGQVNTANLKKNINIRQDGFQETNIVATVKELTKYSVLVTSPEDVIYELEKAHYIMNDGRKGPVLVDIPIDIQRMDISKSTRHFIGSEEHKKMKQASETISFTYEKLQKIEDLLNNAKAPLVLIGNGVKLSQTESQLANFVEHNNLPVVASLHALDVLGASSDNFIGYIGVNGNRDANIILASADLIIILGARLDVRQIGDVSLFNSEAVLVHVDIDPAVIDYAVKSDMPLSMDLGSFFSGTADLHVDVKPLWWHFITNIRQSFKRELSYGSGMIDPNTFIHELSLAADPKALIAVDVGQNQMWCAQSWRAKHGNSLLFSGGMGAMGFALPAVIGAWYVDKKREIIAVCGDGGLQINIQELETVRRNNIPLKLFVVNNRSLGMVREFQDLYFGGNRQSSVTGYGCPDLEKIAWAYGLQYRKIDALRQEDDTIDDILSQTEPLLVEVVVSEDAALTPRVVYGHALDDQAPYLSGEQKKYIHQERQKFKVI